MPGTIIRKGYKRKAYVRKAYVKSDGTRVHASKVKSAYVPPTRIPDLGAPGHGKQLIHMKDYDHLKNYGYHMSDTQDKRYAALRKAAHAKGYAWPIHRLTVVRNLQHRTNPRKSEMAKKDAEYLSKLHKKMA